MALVSSNPFEIGKKALDFTLLNTVNDTFVSLDSLKGKYHILQ